MNERVSRRNVLGKIGAAVAGVLSFSAAKTAKAAVLKRFCASAL